MPLRDWRHPASNREGIKSLHAIMVSGSFCETERRISSDTVWPGSQEIPFFSKSMDANDFAGMGMIGFKIATPFS